MLRLSIFVASSVAMAAMSRRCLRAPHSHGFYRFFAFELILALVLLNAPGWFMEPFSARQLVSWPLLTASLALAVEAYRLLRKVGRPAPAAARGANFGLENTTRLVTVGAYRYIRHPAYASLLALAWGACLKQVSLPSAALALAASGFLVATARAEERENLATFGAAYRAYMKTTRRFIPFVV